MKRDDLFASAPAPPLAKLRGAIAILKELYSQGCRTIGCWDTRISQLGWGLAACASEFPGLKLIVTYPKRKRDTIEPPAIIRARELGAEIVPVAAGRITISFAEARKIVERCGGAMLPFGLSCPEAVEAVSKEAETVPPVVTNGGTVVVSVGSGVTLAGLLNGLKGNPRLIIGVSAGRSITTIQQSLRRFGADTSTVKIVPHECSYSSKASLRLPAPFPCNPYYDAKAWSYLLDNLRSLSEPLLFWNIGA